jgi:tetratricopeptide (TPR) repeat protein
VAVDDQRRRRAEFLRQLAERDLYAWLGIPHDADAATIQAAAAAKRRELSGTPMTQARRANERAYCDQGERVLLRADVRREYDALLHARLTPRAAPAGPGARQKAEREARLQAAKERIQRYSPDDARMAPGATALLADPAARARLEEERAAAAGLTDAAEALRIARAARTEGIAVRALAHAERAHALAPTPATLRTLGAARRDVGDLEGSEAALRESVRALPTMRENAPGWAALAATLRARGEFREAAGITERLIEEDEEDPHGWRAMALVAADVDDVARAAEAWERSAKLGLDVPGALQGLQDLRKACLAADDLAGASDVERRMSRLRPT